jgi:hypothetical protein
MENLNKVISSFDLQKTLNPKIWSESGDKMNPKVRQNLLEIAYQFIKSFGIDVVVDDIIVKGSITNYNWSKYSDVDLHIVIDYEQFSKKLKDLYVEFFDLKKVVFNQKRQLSIFGFDVETYVEGISDEGVSGGIYSILENEWIKKPKKESMNVPKEHIIKTSKKWMRIIDNLLKHLEGETIDTIKDSVKGIKEKLKKYRQAGLAKDGELGLENLVFKVLRRNGYIEKLYDIPIKVIDKKLSLKERLNN